MKFRVAGRLFRESTHTDSKPLARQIERKRQQTLAAARHGLRKPVAPVTFSTAAKDWLTMKEPTLAPKSHDIEKRNIDAHLKPTFGSRLLIDIDADGIARYQRARLKQGAAPKTINLEIGTLRSILRRHRLWAELQPDVKMLPVRTQVGKALTPEEQKRLLDACEASRSRLLLPIVTLALQTGMRRGEIQNLRWSQIDFLSGTLTVGTSKTQSGTGRIIPLSGATLSALKNWATSFPDREPVHFVFPSEHYGIAGNDRQRHAITVDPSTPAGEFKTAWASAKLSAGVTCRFHDLRHTACTRMLEQGAGLAVVASLVGWSASTTANMAKRYGHIGSEAQRMAIERLTGYGMPPTRSGKKQSPDQQSTRGKGAQIRAQRRAPLKPENQKLLQ
jgi:integrase